jgi:hypothetical protein
MANFAVFVPPPAVVTDEPKPTASEEPKRSAQIIFGWCFSSPSLTSRLHITPEDIMAASEPRFQRPGFASRAFNMGFAKASPTITTDSTPWRSTVSKSSSGSKLGRVRVTQQPPPDMFRIAVSSPVPCMSGHAGSNTDPGPKAPTFFTWTSGEGGGAP